MSYLLLSTPTIIWKWRPDPHPLSAAKAAQEMLMSVRPSVCLSVCPSVNKRFLSLKINQIGIKHNSNLYQSINNDGWTINQPTKLINQSNKHKTS